MLRLSLGLGLSAAGGGAVSYEAEATAYFAAMSVAPDATRKSHLNTLIASLKTAGVYTKLDWLTIVAAHDEQAARVNVITPAQVATAVNSPTFTTDRGFTGNGTTSYLDTGWNPSTASSPKFVRNDCHMGVWVGTNVQSATAWDVGNISSAVNSRNNPSASDGFNFRPQYDSSDWKTFGVPLATSIGHSAWNRTTSTAFQAYRDGSSIYSQNQATSAIPNSSILACCRNNSSTGTVTPTGYSTRRIQALHWGSQLTAGEWTSLYNALATYMTAVGA